MDGGVGSSINLAFVEDCSSAVVLVPSGEDTPSPFAGEAAAEIADFHGSAFSVFADESSVAAFGPNPLDRRAGCRQRWPDANRAAVLPR